MCQKMKKSTHTSFIFITLIIIPLLASKSKGDARVQVIKMYCARDVPVNEDTFLANFIRAMEITRNDMQTSHISTPVVGNGPDKNYVLTQCYGDLSSLDCTLCYAQIRSTFPTCYPKRGGRIYLDGCFVRLQNYSFFEEYRSPNDTTICGNTTRKSILFQESARRAVTNVVTGALSNDGYFAREEVSVPGPNNSVFVLAQCWENLSPSSCRACLENASESIRTCLPWSEGRVLNTGCFMRYSDINFLNPVPITGRSSNKGRIIAIVASVISSVAVIAVALMIVIYVKRCRHIQQKRKGSYDAKKLKKILNDSSLHFKYSTVVKATGNWHESNKLGQGGFGTVYKGVLADGREIAVKRLFFNYKFKAADFYNEVNIISTVEHKNLVRLLGCSCSGPESILIYEYLPNKSLDFFIFDKIKGRELCWKKRLEIIMGVAEGLVYLHENTKCRIIHRDIKAPNILLDHKLRPKIADFGLARSFQDDKSHISTAIVGTFGYMAPEYLAHGQLTEKVDVYSFGILILEVVAGMESNRSKKTEYNDSLLSTAWKHFMEGRVEEIFDPNLMMHIYPNINFKKDVIKVVHVALLCTQEEPSLRPSMSRVLKMLANDDNLLPAPSNPPFTDETTMELNSITQRSLDNFDSCDYSSVATVSHSQIYSR